MDAVPEGCLLSWLRRRVKPSPHTIWIFHQSPHGVFRLFFQVSQSERIIIVKALTVKQLLVMTVRIMNFITVFSILRLVRVVDWKNTHLLSWENLLLCFLIILVSVFGYAKGALENQGLKWATPQTPQRGFQIVFPGFTIWTYNRYE